MGDSAAANIVKKNALTTLVSPFIGQANMAKDAAQASAPKPDMPDVPGAVPNPTNSQAALDAAAEEQRRAKGAAATIASNQSKFGGSGGLLTSGGGQSQRMLLGS